MLSVGDIFCANGTDIFKLGKPSTKFENVPLYPNQNRHRWIVIYLLSSVTVILLLYMVVYLSAWHIACPIHDMYREPTIEIQELSSYPIMYNFQSWKVHYGIGSKQLGHYYGKRFWVWGYKLVKGIGNNRAERRGRMGCYALCCWSYF